LPECLIDAEALVETYQQVLETYRQRSRELDRYMAA
jgi:hypothetical protein